MTYNEWWNNVASAMQPLPDEDIEEFVRRMTALAWFNSENIEREACARVCDELPAPDIYSDTDKSMWDVTCIDCADAIRARIDKHDF